MSLQDYLIDDLSEYLGKTDIEYLREYFGAGNTSISLQYRRKSGDEYKEVEMEMILADDYSKDNMSLFLYVK